MANPMEMRRKRENLRPGGRTTVKLRRLGREARTDKSFEQRVDEERLLNPVASPTTRSSALEPLSDPSTQIRLLQIQSSNQDGSLSLNLVVCERENAPPYKAISYTWGDDENPRPLSINGRVFYVTANCYYALWQTQLHFPSCLLWIDSICIKQDDLREKGLQVPQMGRIYGNASQVLACIGTHLNDSKSLACFSRTKSKTLGEEASHEEVDIKEDSDHTLDPWWLKLPFWLRIWWMDISPSYFVSYGSYGWAKYSMAIRVFKFLAVQGTAWVIRQLSPEYRYVSGLSTPFDALAQRPYWQRLWIIQELVKAREIVILCGEDSFPWNDILLLKKMLEGFTRLPESSSIFTFLEATINKKVLSTEELLVRFSKFGCRDPRDRLFGLLGLLRFSRGGSSETHNAFGVPGTFYGKTPINPPRVDYQVPAFEWVLQLANHIPFSLIPKLLQAFEVNASSIGMQNRVAQRRKRQFRQQKLDGPPLSEWSDDYWQSPYLKTSFCRLGLDEKGFLTASLEKQESGPVSAAASCCTTQFPDRPELVTIEKIWQCHRSRRRGQVPQKVMVDGDVAAVVCGAALTGDILLFIKESVGGQVFVVLRCANPHYCSEFDIIGQGFTLGGYGVSECEYKGVNYPPPKEHIFHKAGTCLVNLRITSEDAVMLVGQDYVDEDTYDVQARIGRLLTDVTAFPNRCGQLREAWCVNGMCLREPTGICAVQSAA